MAPPVQETGDVASGGKPFVEVIAEGCGERPIVTGELNDLGGPGPQRRRRRPWNQPRVARPEQLCLD